MSVKQKKKEKLVKFIWNLICHLIIQSYFCLVHRQMAQCKCMFHFVHRCCVYVWPSVALLVQVMFTVKCAAVLSPYVTCPLHYQPFFSSSLLTFQRQQLAEMRGGGVGYHWTISLFIHLSTPPPPLLTSPHQIRTDPPSNPPLALWAAGWAHPVPHKALPSDDSNTVVVMIVKTPRGGAWLSIFSPCLPEYCPSHWFTYVLFRGKWTFFFSLFPQSAQPVISLIWNKPR